MTALRTLTLTRTFAAPCAEVYRMWTDPALVAQWWGIAGSTVPLCELDVRVGGAWRIHMRTASGKIYPNGGTYLDVVPQSRLVYSDEPDPAIAEWSGEVPGTIEHTVRFEPRAAGTLVTLDVLFAAAADRRRLIGFGMDKGLGQGLDRLAQLFARLPAAVP